MTHEEPSRGEGAPQTDVNSPELIEQALGRTKAWLGAWHKDFQAKTGLTPASLRSRTNLLSFLELPNTVRVNTDRGEGVYQIYNIAQEMKALYGNVSFVRLVQAFRGSVPEGAPEGMMMMASPKDFERINAMSEGWSLGESDITYMSVAFSEEGDASIVQMTRPGHLFKGFQGRTRPCQGFKFVYNKEQATWETALDIEGNREVPLMRIRSDDSVFKSSESMDYILPEAINIPKALDNIIAGKPATAE